MTTVANKERPGTLVLRDPTTNQVIRTIRFQYNPATLKRSLQPQVLGGETGNRSYEIRYTGAPVEKYDLQVEMDATDEDKMIQVGGSKVIAPAGIYPDLCLLEMLAYPDSATVQNNVSLLDQGVMEIAPAVAPQILFWWGNNRVAPVTIESFSIEEEFYDYNMSLVRASVSLSLRVLSYTDVAPGTMLYNAYLTYQDNKARAAATVPDSKS